MCGEGEIQRRRKQQSVVQLRKGIGGDGAEPLGHGALTSGKQLRFDIARAVDGCFRSRDDREQQEQREVEKEGNKQGH